MAIAKQLKHRYLRRADLPYVSNDSPTSTDPMWQSGSTNILTTNKGYSERRPGFQAYVADAAFTFSGSLVRFFGWRRWTNAAVSLSGKFFVMYCDVSLTSSTVTRVYKQQVGTDTYPILIHTDPTTSIAFDFELSNNQLFFGNGTDMKKYDGTTVTNWGITGPTAAVTLSAFTTGLGSLTTIIGYSYVIAFENSGTTHLSSPSPQTVSTGSGSLTGWKVSGQTTTDAQVDRVRLGRTIDGGSIYFEMPASPFTYTAWTSSTGYNDLVTTDAALTASGNVMPLSNQNNRPTASFDPVWFGGRIWTHSGDTLYYSDFEELVRGIEEESFAGTNQRQLGREIIKKGVVGQYLVIWCIDIIFRIYGDSLATFKLDVLARGRGMLNAACMTSLTGMGANAYGSVDNKGLAAWLDVSNTVWVTDGDMIKEVSFDIRPDLATIVHASAAMAFHSTGVYHWLILMDGGASRLYVLDMDSMKWMPPWVMEAPKAIKSIQTAPGTWQLFLSQGNKPLVQYSGYLDNSVAYTAAGVTNLFDMVPDDNPSHYGILDHIEVETNAVQPTTMKYLTDEDTASGTYLTFAGSGITPPHRVQGTGIVEKWFYQRGPGCRRISIRYDYAAADSNFKLFGFALSYEVIDT